MNISKTFISINDRGRMSFAILLSNCNLKCSYCDRKDILDKSVFLSTKVMLEQAKHFKNIIFTGGEPLLQWDEVKALSKMLIKENPYVSVEIETNGTVGTDGYDNANIHYIVRPKLTNSKNDNSKRAIHGANLKKFVSKGSKFVFMVNSVEDLDEVKLYVAKHKIPDGMVYVETDSRVITSDESGANYMDLAKLHWLFCMIQTYGFNLHVNMHELLGVLKQETLED